ncbi:hypothetical protein EJ07DRAFT_185879 [Lizonia empirigonia]|nr:hypothetical protein EJ07DRAFT_185879 [Lizonia empirigonia]
MLLTLSIAVLFGIAIAQDLKNVTWPNSFPKQLAAPLTYVQDHVFDSAYGINTTANDPEPSYFGHNDMTELYSRSEDAFATPPPNNYTATVIGPDGNSSSDFSAAISMYAHETFVAVASTCSAAAKSAKSTTYNAFLWLFAADPLANTRSFDNTTFAAPIMSSLLASLAPGSIYNASMHIPVPDLDSRGYYGGYNNPTLNAVLKFWLCDGGDAVTAFRRAQLKVGPGMGVRTGESFVLFTRAVLMYDRSRGIGFDDARAERAVKEDACRSDPVVPPA